MKNVLKDTHHQMEDKAGYLEQHVRLLTQRLKLINLSSQSMFTLFGLSSGSPRARSHISWNQK